MDTSSDAALDIYIRSCKHLYFKKSNHITLIFSDEACPLIKFENKTYTLINDKCSNGDGKLYEDSEGETKCLLGKSFKR